MLKYSLSFSVFNSFCFIRKRMAGCIVTCLLIWGCTPKSETKNQITGSPKFHQYYIKGEQLYLQHCSNCHQKNGTGLGLLYPPLHTSDYMTNNFNDVICLIKNGKKGALMVNGKEFNKHMPGIPTLSDLEIAEIATYIYNTWSHQHGIVDVQQTSTILFNCK